LQIGTKAGADYHGDGLAVSPTAQGARLRCVFQRLEGEATREGLWLTSTVIPRSGTVNDRFRVGFGDGRRLSGCPVVLALAVSGSDLYAGGEFTTAGGISAANIAKWNGSSWSALGSGMGATDDGTNKSVTLPATNSAQFFRLRRP
jgi:hypothetical protein